MPSCLLPVKRCDAKKKQKKKNPTVTFLFTNDLELRILQGLYFKFNEKSLEYLLTPGVFARCRGSNLRSSPGAASPLYNIWVPLLVVLSFLALPHPPPPSIFQSLHPNFPRSPPISSAQNRAPLFALPRGKHSYNITVQKRLGTRPTHGQWRHVKTTWKGLLCKQPHLGSACA